MYQDGRVLFVAAQETPVTRLDPRLLPGARQVLATHGLSGLTLERLSSASGVSRMTLHRRGVSLPQVVEALVADAGQEYLRAVLPPLTGPGDAATRLEAVLQATFAAAERHLPLLAGMFARPDSVFHDRPGPDTRPDAPVASTAVFTAPFARLLQDGAADGSLRAVRDLDVSAAALFNVAGWGYVHLRHSQHWDADHAADAVLDLVLPGLHARPSGRGGTT